MKYKFDVMVALTYEDKDIEVEIDLFNEEVSKIKKLVASKVAAKNKTKDEEEYTPPMDLLQILEENDEALFEKFWSVIMPKVFVEQLINGFDNGYIEKDRKDEFDDYYEADFTEIYEIYGEDIELEHSSCCICKIPEDWLPK